MMKGIKPATVKVVNDAIPHWQYRRSRCEDSLFASSRDRVTVIVVLVESSKYLSYHLFWRMRVI